MVTNSFKSTLADPATAVAERHLEMLGELTLMSLAVTRGHAAAALAAANAVEVILADEIWQPETGRARALAGSKDAAEAFQKVSRSLRLTMAMELATAETLRDLRAGLVTHSRQHAPCKDVVGPRFPLQSAEEPNGPRPADPTDGDRVSNADFDGSDVERLYDIERFDRLPRGSFREIVDKICADLGVRPDWSG